MKKFIITTMMVASACLAFAQSNREDIDLMQSVFGKEKKAMAAEFILVEDPQKDAFWKTYDAYESERKELGRTRIALLERYVSSYASLDDTSTDKIIKDIMKLQGQSDKLIESYYAKVKKTSGVKTAAQFYQFETYILNKLRSAIMERIPMIGQFDNK